jgi:MFS family permease
MFSVRDFEIPNRARLYQRIDRRVLVFLGICYLFAYLDRINISYAKLQMQSDLSLSDGAYGLGAGLFFLGYMLFQVPSNVLLTRIGARKTLSAIMMLWGLASASMMFVHDTALFYGLRFLLGVFEAGFAPGMIYYLTLWYPQARMARALAWLLGAAPVGAIIGGPVSGWIMTALAGAQGLAGWQWLFLLQGTPVVLLGVIAFFHLDDGPSGARWLSPDEQTRLIADLQHRHRPPAASRSFFQVLTDPYIYGYAIVYFCLICGLYTVSFWLPAILQGAGLKSAMEIGLYSAVPYIAAILGMVLVGRSSDRHAERRWHGVSTALLGALALAGLALSSGYFAPALLCITLATALMHAAYTVFWAMASAYTQGRAAAGGIAWINSIGLLGGFVSPALIGWTTAISGSLQSGLFVMAGFLSAGAMLLLVVASRVSAIPRAFAA